MRIFSSHYLSRIHGMMGTVNEERKWGMKTEEFTIFVQSSSKYGFNEPSLD